MEYQAFLETKRRERTVDGIDVPADKLNDMLFDWQQEIVSQALQYGTFAIFAECGLGKTPMQLEWANQVSFASDGSVLILCPLAVAQQTKREADKFHIDGVQVVRDGSEVNGPGIYVTNYERLDKFDVDEFAGIVLDESSILKSFDSKTRTKLIDAFCKTPYRLCCTATPSPNDYMELGNHAEFLGIMTRPEMLSMYFVHDGGRTSQWRLKGHAEQDYWDWMATWAVSCRKPSDLGYEDNGFLLPEMIKHEHVVDVDVYEEGMLFPMPAASLTEHRVARRLSIGDRVKAAADIINGNGEAWIVWCDLNDESHEMADAIGGTEIFGSMSIDDKESRMVDFSEGRTTRLVTKPSIAGFGMNWQHCHNMIFLGLSHSYEKYYQAVRRCWRFGQDQPVNVHIVIGQQEGEVLRTIDRKHTEALKMNEGMVKASSKQIKRTARKAADYKEDHRNGETWDIYLGDCVEVSRELKDESVHYSVFSPPFASLYTYSDSERDMGNSKDDGDFMQHFRFLIDELHRVIMPGRLCSVHCMNLPMMKQRHGEIGMIDFRGDIIRQFEAAGFIYHSEVCIWKDPVIDMQRTKALGLLHKQMVKDAAMCRQGIPDYVTTFRKRGENPEPVAGELTHFIGDPETFVHEGRLSIDVWQRYASPIWTDIRPGRTLQGRAAREERDERHICPLQLDVIERCLHLWTNPGDVVLSPFAGIGSEGYCAVKMDRRFVGIELKESYFKQCEINLKSAEKELKEERLF